MNYIHVCTCVDWINIISVNAALNCISWVSVCFSRHREMEQAEECPQYIQSNGVRTGCTFTRESLPEFSAFNICVNSSSPKVALRSAFFSLQVQNHGNTHIRP